MFFFTKKKKVKLRYLSRWGLLLLSLLLAFSFATHWQQAVNPQPEQDQLPFRLLEERSQNCSRSIEESIACLRSIESLLRTTQVKEILSYSLEGKLRLAKSAEHSFSQREKGLRLLEKRISNMSAIERKRLDFPSLFASLKQTLPKEQEAQAVREALNAWIIALDPHAQLVAKAPQSLEPFRTPKEHGIGAKLRIKEEKVFVAYVQEGSGAEESGLQAGDQILRIEGEDAFDFLAQQKHKSKNLFSLQILREGKVLALQARANQRELSLIESSIRQNSQGESIGLLRIRSFQDPFSCLKTERALRKWNRIALKGIILDLRNNSGGLIREAACVAGLFAGDNQPIAAFKRLPEKLNIPGSAIGNADRGDFLLTTSRSQINHLPLLILVNENTASSSEILAAGLHELGRAALVGEKTFGKASMQSLMHPWEEESLYLSLTTHKIFSPKGESWENKGLEPDLSKKKIRAEKISDGLDFFAGLGSRALEASRSLRAKLDSTGCKTHLNKQAAIVSQEKDADLSLAAEALNCL